MKKKKRGSKRRKEWKKKGEEIERGRKNFRGSK